MGTGSSKASFKEALQALNDHDIPAGDDEFWGNLWRLNTSALEIFEVIAPDSVRKIRQERPNNIAALFNRAVEKLCSVVESPFEHSGRNFEETLVCVRILTRVLPFLLESYRDEATGEADHFLEKLFWASSENEAEGTTMPLGSLLINAVMQLLFLRGFTIDATVPGHQVSKTTASTRTRRGTVPSSSSSSSGGGSGGGGGEEGQEGARLALGNRDSSIDYLTVANPEMCWEVGLQAVVVPGTSGGGTVAKMRYSHVYERNRVEVMRLLLCMLCEPLFQTSESFDPTVSRWAAELTRQNVPFAAELFTSLMNCALSFDPVGWGVPYGAAVVSDAPTKQMEMCNQVLVALLDCGMSKVPVPPAAEGAAAAKEGDEIRRGPKEEERICELDARGRTCSPPAHGGAHADNSNNSSSSSNGGGGGVDDAATAASPRQYNVYRDILASISDVKDFNFIFQGLNRMLNNVHESRNTYMPGATMQVSSYQELLVLFWKLIEENPAFTGYLLKMCDVTTLLVPICFLLLEYRKEVAKGGLIHINTFILLKLSGERNFGVNLNKEYKARLPVDLPLFSGTHCDLLILTLHKLMVSGNERLSSLYHCFLTIICNVSPYCKSLSLVASMKLVSLFELYTSPRFLYAAETNHIFISLLLEMFNNIIQYQYIGNAHLVYAIIRRKEVFERLHRLSLTGAIQAAHEQSHFEVAAASAAAKIHATGVAGEDAIGGVDVAVRPGVPKEEVLESTAAAGGGGGGGGGAEGGISSSSSGGGGGGNRRSSAPETAAAVGGGGGAGGGEHSKPQRRPRFVPTQEWLSQVQSELPMNTIMRLIQYLVPQIDDMCRQNDTVDEAMVVNFLKNTTMVGLLPVPHPIVIRKYQPNHYTALWFTAFMWGVIFVRNQELPIFDGQKIRLFTVTLT